MYVPVDPQPSCARAWAAAASAIADHGEAYNVIIDVDNPAVHDDTDHAVIALVDGFLRKRGDRSVYPISTVANTIFPQALYDEYGAPRFYDEYLKVYDSLTNKRWGRYFERMARHKTLDGKVVCPLADLVEKIKRRTGHRHAYELAIYDTLQDGRVFRGGQCLSFLSFKLHPERGLCLTAIYRNHTYITRCLGNLIGLGRLQAFIAKETDLRVGSLTCVSTHAYLDTPSNCWGISDARSLVSDAMRLCSNGHGSQSN